MKQWKMALFCAIKNDALDSGDSNGSLAGSFSRQRNQTIFITQIH